MAMKTPDGWRLSADKGRIRLIHECGLSIPMDRYRSELGATDLDQEHVSCLVHDCERIRALRSRLVSDAPAKDPEAWEVVQALRDLLRHHTDEKHRPWLLWPGDSCKYIGVDPMAIFAVGPLVCFKSEQLTGPSIRTCHYRELACTVGKEPRVLGRDPFLPQSLSEGDEWFDAFGVRHRVVGGRVEVVETVPEQPGHPWAIPKAE